jgi:hypothetical protein
VIGGITFAAVTAIVVGLLIRHRRHDQSESAKEMVSVDDLGDGSDDGVSSDDYEQDIFDVEGGGDGAATTDGNAKWLNFDGECSSSYFDDE